MEWETKDSEFRLEISNVSWSHGTFIPSTSGILFVNKILHPT